MKTIKFKRYTLVIASIFLVIISSSFNYKNGDSVEVNILGMWVSNDDNLWKIEFLENNIRKDYYEGVLEDTYTYSLTNTCDTNTSFSNDLFLKTIDSDSDITCDVFNGIHVGNNGITTLSITSEKGSLNLFTRIQ